MNYKVQKKHDTRSLEKVIEHNQMCHPFLYHVIIHNDDFTPMDFVVGILESIFWLSKEKAKEIMLSAHKNGKAKCGIYSKDVAYSKIDKAMEHAKLNEHPLLCSMEPAS